MGKVGDVGVGRQGEEGDCCDSGCNARGVDSEWCVLDSFQVGCRGRARVNLGLPGALVRIMMMMIRDERM